MVSIVDFTVGELVADTVMTAPWPDDWVSIAVDEALDASAPSDASLATVTSFVARGRGTFDSEVVILSMSSTISNAAPVSLISFAIYASSAWGRWFVNARWIAAGATSMEYVLMNIV